MVVFIHQLMQILKEKRVNIINGKNEFIKVAGKDYKMFSEYYGLNIYQDEFTLNRRYDDSSFIKKWKINKRIF